MAWPCSPCGSATYVQPGEQLVCQGCHEPRHRAPDLPAQMPLALRRAPSIPTPDVDGTNPFSYPRLVQPVLDRHCVSCHRDNAEKATRLDSEVIVKGRQKWYASYFSLAPKYGFWSYGQRHRTTPGQFGARAAKLYSPEGRSLRRQAPARDLHRLTVWLDSCSISTAFTKEGGEAQHREIVAPRSWRSHRSRFRKPEPVSSGIFVSTSRKGLLTNLLLCYHNVLRAVALAIDASTAPRCVAGGIFRRTYYAC